MSVSVLCVGTYADLFGISASAGSSGNTAKLPEQPYSIVQGVLSAQVLTSVPNLTMHQLVLSGLSQL